MRSLDYRRFVFPIIFLIVMIIVKSVFNEIITFDYVSYLIIIGAITLVYSFDFIHTQLGQNASRTNTFNEYTNIKYDMKYHLRNDRGYTLEHLLIGIIEIAIGLIMIFIGVK